MFYSVYIIHVNVDSFYRMNYLINDDNLTTNYSNTILNKLNKNISDYIVSWVGEYYDVMGRPHWAWESRLIDWFPFR